MQSTSYYPPRGKKQARNLWFWSLLITVLMIGIVVYIFNSFILKETANNERVQPDFGGLEKPIIIGGELQELQALGEADGLMLPFDLLKEKVDPYLAFDEASDSVIITTEENVIRMPTGQLSARLNEEPFELHFPVTRVDEQIYVPIAPLLDIYEIHIREAESTGAVFLYHSGDIVQPAKTRTIMQDDRVVPVPMRTKPTLKAPISADLEAGVRLFILEDPDDAPEWYRVQLESGYTGFVRKDHVQLAEPEFMRERRPTRPHIPWSPLGGKINLTWEHAVSRTADPSKFGTMPGLNVVSPTWFSLKEDKNGNIYVHNIADPTYVQWAHREGYQVWALFSNDFNPDLTTRALADFETRHRIIKQIVSFVQMYGLQGINIDFENVYLKEQSNVTQFVRELTPYLHEVGAVVSIDVTIRGGSEMWSLFLDRKALGEVVDYMMVMTYDEHWASSPVAGSVASLPWVEKGIADIIEHDDVPPHKLLVGVPFYTYQWTEEVVDGKVKVSSKARFMADVQNLIAEKKLEPIYLPDIGQHYVEYEEDGKKIKIWIEDAVSMRQRAELVNKYDLAGIASWRRGFETPDIWEVIHETLSQRP